MAVTELTLDTAKPQDRIEMVTGRQGDTATVIRVTVLNNGDAYDFDGKYLEFAMVRPKGDAKVEWIHLKEAVVQEGSTNVWNCTLPEAATAYDGLAKLCYFVVRSKTDESFRDSTQRFMVKLDASATAEVHVGYYSDQVDKLIREAILLTEQWEQQIEAQQAAYLAAEARRDESYEAAEAERGTRYSQAEHDRNARFEQSETARQNTFNQNEADRGKRSNEAVQEANAATDRANKAADDVHQALTGDLSAVFDTYLDTKKDAAGGFPKWETYQTGIKNAGTPDDVTLAKDSANKLYVKDAGITTAKIADLNVTTAKLANGCVTNAKLGSKCVSMGNVSDYLLWNIGILDTSAWSQSQYSSFLAELNASERPVFIDYAFNRASWAGLGYLYLAVATSERSYFVGKTRDVSMTGYGSILYRVIGVGVDDIVSGGKASMTFNSVPIIARHAMNSNNTTSGGWASTEMRTWLNGTLYGTLPSDLRSVIVQVKKKYCATTTFTNVSTSNDKFWLLSGYEVFGDTGYGTDGVLYQWFSEHNDNASRIKNELGGSAYYWWLRSLYSSSYFRSVDSGGGATGSYPGNAGGVAPCFAIR